MRPKEFVMPVKKRNNGYRVMAGKPERTTWKTEAQMGE
jgi:hypothetical protein